MKTHAVTPPAPCAPNASRAPGKRLPAPRVAFAALALAAHAFFAADAAAQINITENTTIITTASISSGQTLSYTVSESATLSISASSANRRTFWVTGTLNISGPGQTFVGNIATTAGNGGIILASGGGSVNLENVTFSRNEASDGVATVMFLQGSTDKATMKNVVFDNNFTLSNNTGVIRNSGSVGIYDSIFRNNFASVNIGAYGANGADAKTTMSNVQFIGNRTGVFGGAVGLAAQTWTENTFTNAIFTDNWAYGIGGAVYIASGNVTGLYTFAYTAAGGTNAYRITGNFAGGTTLSASSTLAGGALVTGVADFTASAASGGFLWFNNQGRIDFKVDDGVTLTIGDGVDLNKDTIASAGANARLSKSGVGTLILNSDNSYFQGAFSITEGSVILGNAGAKLGGTITLSSGARLAGIGTIETNGATAALTASNGSIVQIGLDGATAPQTLTINGNLNANNNSTFRFDLFTGGTSDRLLVFGALTAAGTPVIDIATLITGTYNLGNITNLSGAKVTLGGLNMGGTRQTATLNTTVNPGFLTLITAAEISRELTWTGNANTTWNLVQENWSATVAGSPQTIRFAAGDRVLFDLAASGTITLAGTGETRVSDIQVGGASDLTFTGAASLTADAAYAYDPDTGGDSLTGMQGKLSKTGAGTLTFDNTGKNTFKGGIDLGGGVIAFSRADQIDTTGTAIRVTADSALRANAAIADLGNTIAIDAGKTLTLDTQGNAVTYAGQLQSAGAFVKTGAGALTLTGNSSAFAGSAHFAAGDIFLKSAQLGGAITLGAGIKLAGEGSLGAGGGSFTAQAGSIIDIGLSAAQPGALAFGALTLDTTTLILDLFGQSGGSFANDSFTAASLTLVGTSTLQIGAFQTGTYTLGVIGNLATVSNFNTALVFDLGDNTRASGTFFTSGDNLMFDGKADVSRAVVWTGAGTAWSAVGNWTGSSAVDNVASGDRVLFDASAPTANCTVTVANNAYASDMLVSAGGYTFIGAGSINTGTRYVSTTGPAEFGDTATGKLVKTGDGVLRFENTGGNYFEGGITMGGGAIEFSDANQLRTGPGAAITFTESGTLYATGISGTLVHGTLSSNIEIAPDKTAVIRQYNHALVFTGTLLGDATTRLVLRGPTNFNITGDSSRYAGTTEVHGMTYLLTGTLGGNVNVESGGKFGGWGAVAGSGTVYAKPGSIINAGADGGAFNTNATLTIPNLVLANSSTLTGHGVLRGNGVIGETASDTVTVITSGSLRVDFSGTLAGPGKAVFEGSGTKTLTGKLSAGAVELREGVINLNNIHGATVLESVAPIALSSAATLTGYGTIKTPSFTNDGVIRAGHAGGASSFGKITIDGNYIGGADSKLFLDIGVIGDHFSVTGAASGVTQVYFIQTITPLLSYSMLPLNLITAGDGQNNSVFVVQNGVEVANYSTLVYYDVASGTWVASSDPLPSVSSVIGLNTATLFMGKAALTSLSQRLTATRDNAAPHGWQLWLNGLYRHDNLKNGISTMYPGTSVQTNGVQAGADWTGTLEAANLTLGLFYDSEAGNLDDVNNQYYTQTRSNAFGGYFEVRSGAWYTSLIARGSEYKQNVSIPYSGTFEAKGGSAAASLELGAILSSKSERYAWHFEPQLAVTYQAFFADDVVDYAGRLYVIDDAESLEYRAGIRVWNEFQWAGDLVFKPYFAAHYLYEMKARAKVQTGSDTYTNNLGGAAFRGDFGASLQLARGWFVNAEMNWLFSDKYESYGFNFGMSLTW